MSITNAQLDEMPALLLDEVLHRDPQNVLPGYGYQAFHRILEQRMAGVDPADNDRLYGDAGDDTLYARDSAYDILMGGEGTDWATYDPTDLRHDLLVTIA